MTEQTGPEQTGPEQTGADQAGAPGTSSPAGGLGWPSAPAPERTRFVTPAAAPVTGEAGPEPVTPEPVEPVTPEPVEPVTPEPLEPVTPEPLEPVTPQPVEPVNPEPLQPVTPEPLLAASEAPLAAEPEAEAVPAPREQELTSEAGEPVASRGKGLVAVLAGVVLVLAALTGFLAWRAHDTEGLGPVAASRASALDAARSSARLVFSYDYRHLAQDFKAGRAVTTGQFQGEYDKTTAKLVTDVAPRYKAVVVADVSDAGVVSATKDQVVALVFLNQQSSSSLVAQPKITQSRLEMTMVRSGGRWLVSRIKAL